jgi:hypothetical protein
MSVSALGEYFESIANSFAAETNPDGLEPPPVAVWFGRKEAYRQDNRGTMGRVAIMPGEPSGAAGSETAPRYPGSDPRPLKDTGEKFTVYLWGYDRRRGFEEGELAQYEVADALYRAWRKYTFLKYEGTVTMDSRRWRSPERIERQFGRELEVVCTIRSPVRDEGLTVLTGVGADIHVTAIDITDSTTVSMDTLSKGD